MRIGVIRRTARAPRGVTLIEALATVVVLGIVLPALMQGLSLSTRVAGLTRHKAEATTLAEEKLGEIIATGEWQNAMAPQEIEGDITGYTWQAGSVEWDAGIEEVRVVVSWLDQDRTREVTVSTLVYTGSTGVNSTATQPSSGGLR